MLVVHVKCSDSLAMSLLEAHITHRSYIGMTHHDIPRVKLCMGREPEDLCQ
jgi:hypothetical protein